MSTSQLHIRRHNNLHANRIWVAWVGCHYPDWVVWVECRVSECGSVECLGERLIEGAGEQGGKIR